MTAPRRYTKRQKAAAIVAVELTSQVAAAEATGIPRSTIQYWLDDPEFVALRQKTREQLAEGSIVLAQLAQASLSQKIREDKVEPRDLATIYGIAIDKGQLLAGQPTARTETVDLPHWDDHETLALAELAREELQKRAANAAD